MFLSLILPLYSRFSWTCSRFPSREFNQRLFCAPNKAAVRVIRCKLKGQSLTEAAEPLPDKEKKKPVCAYLMCWTLKSWHVGHLSVTQEEQQTAIEAFPPPKKTHHVSVLEKSQTTASSRFLGISRFTENERCRFVSVTRSRTVCSECHVFFVTHLI